MENTIIPLSSDEFSLLLRIPGTGPISYYRPGINDRVGNQDLIYRFIMLCHFKSEIANAKFYIHIDNDKFLESRDNTSENSTRLTDFIVGRDSLENALVICEDLLHRAYFMSMFEDYEKISRPLSLNKTIDDIIRERKTDKILMKITNGIFIDLYKNVMYFSPVIEETSKANVSFTFGLMYFKPFVNLSRDIVRELISTDTYFLDEILNHKLNAEVQNAKNIYNEFQNVFINNAIERLRTYDTGINELMTRYMRMLENKEVLRKIVNSYGTDEEQNAKAQQNNEKFIKFIERLIKNRVLSGVRRLAQNRLKLEFNPLPIIYFEMNQLEKSYKNIVRNQKHLEYIEKVIAGTHSFYTGPMSAVVTLTVNNEASASSLNFTTEVPYYTVRMNRHPMYDSGYGCRGTFAQSMAEAGAEGDLTKLIALIQQYYQSMSVLDGLGSSMVGSLPIVNNETGFMAYDPQSGIDFENEGMEVRPSVIKRNGDLQLGGS